MKCNEIMWDDKKMKPLLIDIKKAHDAGNQALVNQLYAQAHPTILKLAKYMIYKNKIKGVEPIEMVGWIWIKFISSFDINTKSNTFSYFYMIARSYIATVVDGYESIGNYSLKKKKTKTYRLSRDVVESIIPELKGKQKKRSKTEKTFLQKKIRNTVLQYALTEETDEDIRSFVNLFGAKNISISYHKKEDKNTYRFVLCGYYLVTGNNFESNGEDQQIESIDTQTPYDLIRNTQIDFAILAQYVPDIPISNKIKDLAIDFCHAVDRSFAAIDKINLHPRANSVHMISAINANLERHPASYTKMDLKIALAVINKAYKLYQEDFGDDMDYVATHIR